jgi:hypothetical protein
VHLIDIRPPPSEWTAKSGDPNDDVRWDGLNNALTVTVDEKAGAVFVADYKTQRVQQFVVRVRPPADPVVEAERERWYPHYQRPSTQSVWC